MSDLKKGTGDATEHPINRQNERGAGVKNQPFTASHGPDKSQNKVQGNRWKSMVNPNQPNQGEIKNKTPAAPVTRPNEPLGKSGHVAQAEIAPHGRQNTSSTYRAPRKEGGHDPLEAGYTKPGKM